MKIVVVSGGFDPLHSGHLAYFEDARSYGDRLIVALNSDEWLEEKKGKAFMPFMERKLILEALRSVDEVISFEDDNLGSCINALISVRDSYAGDEIYFANGGDRNEGNIPEMEVENINFLFGVGGDDKKNSSSWILKNWKYYKEQRLWGTFYNLFEDVDVKVKELIVDPGEGMSFQKHFKRNEIWLVSKGSCEVNFSNDAPENRQKIRLDKFHDYHVPVGKWHQITNPFEEPCHLIEIQYGEQCIEDDIERVEYYKPQ